MSVSIKVSVSASSAPPPDLACHRCGDTVRIRPVRHAISGVWWVCCQVEACGAVGVGDYRVLEVELVPSPSRDPDATG